MMVNGFGFCCCNNTGQVWLYSVTNSATFTNGPSISSNFRFRERIHLFGQQMETGTRYDDVRAGLNKSDDPLEGFRSLRAAEVGDRVLADLTRISGNDYRLLIGFEGGDPEQNSLFFTPIDFTHDFSGESLYESEVVIDTCTIHFALRLVSQPNPDLSQADLDQIIDDNLDQSWKRNNQPENLNVSYYDWSANTAGPSGIPRVNYTMGGTASRVGDRHWQINNIAELSDLNFFDRDLRLFEVGSSPTDIQLVVVCHDPWHAIAVDTSLSQFQSPRRQFLLWDATKTINSEVNRAVVTFDGVESNLNMDGAPLLANSGVTVVDGNTIQDNTTSFLSTIEAPPLPLLEGIIEHARSIFSLPTNYTENINFSYGYAVKPGLGDEFDLLIFLSGTITYRDEDGFLAGRLSFDGNVELQDQAGGLPFSDVISVRATTGILGSFSPRIEFPFTANVESIRPWQ